MRRAAKRFINHVQTERGMSPGTVDSYGDDTTYKVGLNWQITDSWRFRATQGTSFRTPALYELYLADQTSFIGQRFIDPCINWGDTSAVLAELAQASRQRRGS
mgnify:CR=1 FL=1